MATAGEPIIPEVITIETPTLGDRSYLVIADGWAVAVDVQRDLDRVERVLDDHGVNLAAVVETHIHNDYITGGLALARRHRASYVVPAGPRLGFTALRAEDGFSLQAGSLEVRSIATPGHTDAHATYAIGVSGGSTVSTFTGGSLLLGGTGRTDLISPDLAEELARRQYWSVRRLARLLPHDTTLYPTHGFGSFCVAGSPVGGEPTLAAQMAVNPAFLLSEDEFVARSLGVLGPPPRYYSFMGPRNAGGPTAPELTPLPQIDTEELNRLRELDNATVVDVRTRERFAAGHVPGSLHLHAQGSIATWLGWVTPIDTPVVVVADTDDEADLTHRELSRIGFDDVRGVLPGSVLDALPRTTLATTPRVTFDDLAHAPEGVTVLDVRERSEWDAGHLPSAVHVPVHKLDAAELPAGDLWVHCAAGFRAGLAVSLLERLGVSTTWIDDSFSNIASAAVSSTALVR